LRSSRSFLGQPEEFGQFLVLAGRAAEKSLELVQDYCRGPLGEAIHRWTS
ncbi:hypothetical protein NDU88_004667, partial [Pleurodeles waltl]